MRWAHFHQVRNSTIVLPLGHLLRVFYTSAVYFTLPQLFTLPQCILHFPNGLWQQMPPQKQPIDAQCIVLFVCWAHFLPYCSTGDASSETPIRHILYYTFCMLSILPPMLFCIKCILRSTHQAHNILYFSYVEHTSAKSEIPPLSTIVLPLDHLLRGPTIAWTRLQRLLRGTKCKFDNQLLSTPCRDNRPPSTRTAGKIAKSDEGAIG